VDLRALGVANGLILPLATSAWSKRACVFMCCEFMMDVRLRDIQEDMKHSHLLHVYILMTLKNNTHTNTHTHLSLDDSLEL
jgi:hypothetical protein